MLQPCPKCGKFKKVFNGKECVDCNPYTYEHGTQLVQTPLWGFQQEDITSLMGEGEALLGWQMGCGKTLSALERDMRFREVGEVKKTLIVAPMQTHEQWRDAVRDETDLRVSTINPKKRHNLLSADAEFYTVHWEALRLMPDLREAGFDHVIADECHKLKNRKSAQTKALKRIPVRLKTDMSGSPVTDRPQDFWSTLNHLYPRSYTSYWRFYEDFVDYEIIYPQGYHKILGPSEAWEKEGLPAIRPFYRRRLAIESVPELAKLGYPTYHKEFVDLSPQQRTIYEQMSEEMIAWLGSQGDQPLIAPVVISKLQRLQMIAIAHLAFDEDGRVIFTEPSSKLDALCELIEDNPSLQFVVYSQFKGPHRLMERRCKELGITYANYTGDVPQKLRPFAKRKFINGDAQLLLATVGAGGVGVDGLQHASHNCVFLDRDWSPMMNEQAEFRVFRAGQKIPVRVTDIMARNTIDWGRFQRIELKGQWVRKMLGDRNLDV